MHPTVTGIGKLHTPAVDAWYNPLKWNNNQDKKW